MSATKKRNSVINIDSDDANDAIISLSGNSRNSRQRDRKSLNANQITPKLQYKFGNFVKENHGHELFGTQFNPFLMPDQPYIFATVGGCRVSIYQCLKDGGLKLVQCYSDPDPEEKFYTCAWTTIMVSGSPHPILAVAGGRGVIRIIDAATKIAYKHLIGHTYQINELKFHPKLPHVLLSASKDYSLRLWNIKTDVCIAIFGGVEGHRDEVLSVDFDRDGNRIVSAGIDHTIKIWCINKPEMKLAIEKSNTFIADKSEKFKTIGEHFPDYSTRGVHSNYVDCIRWFGNLLMSKDSKQSSIVCWKPGKVDDNNYTFKSGDSTASILHRFNYKNCHIWFMRFALDHSQKYMAFGNEKGKIFVWDLDAEDPKEICPVTLSHPKCVSPIRQISFSRDARVLVSVCDDGSVWRWDR